MYVLPMKVPRTAICHALFLGIFLSVQSCSSSDSARRPAAGGIYEVTDREKIQRRDSLLVDKYASILETDPSFIEDSFSLYQFIDQQLNTPCSDTPGKNQTNDVQLTQQIFEQVYHRKIPASYRELKESRLIPKFSARSYLAEGDLIFFEHTPDNSSTGKQQQSVETAIGLYLHNSRFLICSEKAGAVVVNKLDSRYWDQRYKMAGRLK